MKMLSLVLLFVLGCGRGEEESTIPAPQPTPTPVPFTLQTIYDLSVDGERLWFSTPDIIKDHDDVTRVDHYFFTGDSRDGVDGEPPATICQAEMSLRPTLNNTYFLTIYKAYYAEFNNELNDVCAKLDGYFYLKLTSNTERPGATIERTK